MRLPDFIIIGAGKAGTTSIHALLQRHPDVYMPPKKELEFFARDELYANGIESYASNFSEARENQMIGEASPIYSMMPVFPSSASRMAEHIPNLRMIYILRDPVDRAYSHYVQIIKNYQNASKDYSVHRTFEDFSIPEKNDVACDRSLAFAEFDAHLPDTPELILSGSDYVFQIERYLEKFPRENLLFLTFESFRVDPIAALRKITDFLGLAPLDPAVFSDGSTTRNISSKHFESVSDIRGRQLLKSRFSTVWGLRRLLPVRQRRQVWHSIAPLFGMSDWGHVPPPMKPATRAWLAARFAPDLPRLRELTELDLSEWSVAAEVEARREAT